MNLKINNRFSTELPADPDETNETRQVKNACFSFVTPRNPTKPSLVHISHEVAALIGITLVDLESEDFLHIITGKKILSGTKPYAMSYAGHQFGNWGN
jgi:uncharacterized protein YdiU (UPF0061 family)